MRSGESSTDHYYFVTAFLAARGLQTRVCRFIATLILGCGAVPAVLALTRSAPRPAVVTTAVVVALACTAMAMLWLRRRWPTRAQSIACLLVGSLCAAAACLVVAPRPVVALVGSTVFVVLSAHSTFFHTPRLLIPVWAVGGVTLIVLAARIADRDAVLAVSAVVVLVLVNLFIAYSSRMVIRLIETDTHFGEIDSLTGLLTYGAFIDRLAMLLGARSRTDDRYLALIHISLDSITALDPSAGLEARVAVAHEIRLTLRHNASIARSGDAEFLVADVFPTEDCSVLTERLLGTVVSSPFRLSASIGAVTTPLGALSGAPPVPVAEELIALAEAQTSAARRAGGNQTRHDVCPSLLSLTEPRRDDFPA